MAPQLSNKENDLSPFEKYLNHLDDIFIVEPKFQMFDSKNPKLNGVTSIIYENIPEKGMTTGVTYGLSLYKHPEWLDNIRGEIMITVNSPSIDWGLVVGFLANKFREKCPFCYGDTLSFGERISEDSEMDAFFVFSPSILDEDYYLNIDVGLEYKIHIAGVYPMYSSEIDTFHDIGIKEFLENKNFDLYSVNRDRIEKI